MVLGVVNWKRRRKVPVNPDSDLLISDGSDWSGVIAKLFAKSMRPTRKAGWRRRYDVYPW
jgi:hypothetical protein